MLHKTYPANRLALAVALTCTAAMLGASGCMHPVDDELTTAVVTGERPVAMEGSSPFFGGKLTAKVTVSRGIGRGLKRGRGDRDKTYRDYADNSDKAILGSPLPPVTLHLSLTNNGAEPVTVTLVDFISELGNFAIEPDTLTIPAGQSAEPTAMVSQLGVSSDEIPFKVTLVLGKVKESGTVLAKILHPDASAPAAK